MSAFKYNILIVDDHPFTLKILTKILEKQDYTVFSFTNPMEAFEFLTNDKNQIDLVVSDMMMQEMTGMELLTKVKQRFKISQIPFIFLSAAHNDNIRREAFEKGALDFFDKPVNTNLFVSKIQTILQNISHSQLNGSILLTGDEGTLSPQDVLKYCEMEKLNGFVYFSNATLETVFKFTKGVIEYSSFDDKLSSDFELLLTWKKYTFIVAHSKFNLNAVRHYFKQIQLSSNTNFASSNARKFDSFFSKFPTLLEIFVFEGTWNAIQKPGDYTYAFLLESLYSLSSTLQIENKKTVNHSKIILQNNNILLLIKYHKSNLAFLFSSDEDCSRLHKIWKASQK